MPLIPNKRCGGPSTYCHTSTSFGGIVLLGKRHKRASSIYIKEKNLFEGFVGWQDGYGAFTYTIKEKDRLIAYVKNQEEHHRKKTFKDEYIELLKEHGVDYDEKYLM